MEIIKSNCQSCYGISQSSNNIVCESFVWKILESPEFDEEVINFFKEKYLKYNIWVFTLTYKPYPLFEKDKQLIQCIPNNVKYLKSEVQQEELDRFSVVLSSYKLSFQFLVEALNVIKKIGHNFSYIIISKRKSISLFEMRDCLLFNGKRYSIDYLQVFNNFCIKNDAVVNFFNAFDGAALNCYSNDVIRNSPVS